MKSETCEIGLCFLMVVAFAFITEAGQVFSYDEAHPVMGMPQIRSARPAGERFYKPASYDAAQGGWVIIAESFDAYKAAKRSGAAGDSAELPTASKAAPGSDTQSQILDSTSLPLNLSGNVGSWNSILLDPPTRDYSRYWF